MPAPYVLSSDLVSAYPAKSVDLATYIDTSLAAKTDLAMVQNAQTGSSYSYALADASKLLTMSNASANTVLVTKQATVTWVTGTQLRVMNLGAGVTTLVADTGVTINNNKALAQYQGGTLIRTASDVWAFVPNASAAASATATVATSQTTASAAFADLATAGPAVTITTGTKALVIISALAYHSVNGNDVYMGFAVSGASTVAAADTAALYMNYYNSLPRFTYVYYATGLTAGSNTFTAKYRTNAATATFANRTLSVLDMGS